MRILLLSFVAALAACASGAAEPDINTGPSLFPVERGTAPPPPQESPNHAAPPEGVAPGGVDFGQWRGADPAHYAPAFQTQINQRYNGADAAHIRADLEANGFVCTEVTRLDCRIEIMERQCAVDWYVVVERDRPEPIAGFDRMCLGAR